MDDFGVNRDLRTVLQFVVEQPNEECGGTQTERYPNVSAKQRMSTEVAKAEIEYRTNGNDNCHRLHLTLVHVFR
jgi:hypothetical protein